MLIEKIYDYYLYNIHYMVNTLGYKYQFAEIWRFMPINFGEYDISDFSRLPNPFLLDYQDDKLKLAADILENGMYFPFFGGRLENQVNPCLYFILQGKHRLYSLRRYSDEVEHICDKFLFIDYPIDIQYFRSCLDKDMFDTPIKMYNITEDLEVFEEELGCYTETLKIMDRFGTTLGKCIYKMRREGAHIAPPAILTDEKLFEEFINSPFGKELV